MGTTDGSELKKNLSRITFFCAFRRKSQEKYSDLNWRKFSVIISLQCGGEIEKAKKTEKSFFIFSCVPIVHWQLSLLIWERLLNGLSSTHLVKDLTHLSHLVKDLTHLSHLVVIWHTYPTWWWSDTPIPPWWWSDTPIPPGGDLTHLSNLVVIWHTYPTW